MTITKTPVVYWTSKWVPTGETEIKAGEDNKAIYTEKKILVGERNKEYQRKA